MHQIYPDIACRKILGHLLGGMIHMNLHLYVNNLTPDLNTTLGDFTVASFTGYLTQSVAAADFSVSTAGHLSTGIADPVAFTNSSGGPVSVYGYYLTGDDGALIGCARFDSAPLTIDDGDSLPVVPIIGDFSQYSS